MTNVPERVRLSEYYYQIRASAFLQSNQPEQAVPFLERATELNPDSILAYFQLGTAYYQQAISNQRSGEKSNLNLLWLSEDAFQHVLRLNDELTVVYFKLGKIALLQNKPLQAREYYAAGLKYEPDNAALLYNLGRVYDELGETEQAITYYNKTVISNPKFVYAYNNMGLLYEEQKNYSQAEKSYQAALQRDPEYTMARVNLANLYALTGRYKEAESQFKAAILQNPQDEWSRYYQGSLYVRMAEYEKAAQSYEACLYINENMSDAYYMLTYTYSMLNRFEAAAQTSLLYLQRAPNGAHAKDMKQFLFAAKLALSRQSRMPLFHLRQNIQK